MRTLTLGIMALAASTAIAVGASDDAWEQFRKDVAAACLLAPEPMFEAATARVDPFGSES